MKPRVCFILTRIIRSSTGVTSATDGCCLLEMPIATPRTRNSRRNFSNPPPVIGDNIDKATKSEAMENKAMASIIALAEAHDDKFNLINVMEYRVTDECLPIYNVNGTMRKTQMSKLVDKLYMETLDSKEYIAIVDM
ncbi:hypothetical protein GWK47_037296 [Chionoecetes opilio]|uniref:Uncharacterized protein n=1 Tax=Chionoecetes opilio TaxID=41210 RepID=A0A8J4YPZ9_CHIOP|nr:hypothetical protein GWK47_037296 [Chionoecetes opilio]